MTRFPSIPQLSIVVPVTDQVAAFESSLVSVLENRPEHCEIIVAHDGSYDDPFDLGDEVRFVESNSHSLVDLVQSSTSQARGRFIHVLAEGIAATADWTSAALDRLDDPAVGFVAPTILQRDGRRVVACGWTDTPHRLCDAVGAGSSHPEQGEVVRAIGSYLQSSFWRRDLLRSMGKAFRGSDGNEASYAYGLLARQAGWRGAVAMESQVLCDDDSLPWHDSNLDRGRRLRAIRHQLHGGGWAESLAAGLRSATACLTGRVAIGEAIGQATAPLAEPDVELLLFAGEAMSPDDYEATVRFPRRVATRRAA